MSTPIAIVHASATMLPRLVAEESLLASARTAVGTGSLDQDEAKCITREWAALTDQSRRAVVKRPTPSDLAAIGIGVIEVPRG